MDALTPQEVADRVASDPTFQAKYDARYQRGDIVEVWPDGEGEWRVKGNPQFSVVKVPGMAVEQDHMAALMDGEVILKRRKWSFPVAKIPPAIILTINKENVVTVSLAQFQNLEILTRAQKNLEGFVPPVLEAKG